MVPGILVLKLAHDGLRGIASYLEDYGGFVAGTAGPASWDWARVEEALTKAPPGPVAGGFANHPGGEARP
jgi:hypothetical protein